MTYRGRVQNGVVVFQQRPPIAEGTEVEVQPLISASRRGLHDTVLRHNVRWSGPAEELERLTHEVQEMREQDLVWGCGITSARFLDQLLPK